MNKKKSLVGALLASALCVCALGAFAATSASAATMHECLSTGGGTGTKYTTSECNTPGSGSFETVAIPAGSAVNVTPTGTSNFTLGITAGGVKFKISCTGLMGIGTEAGGEATAENNASPMDVKGMGRSEFTGCGVVEPTTCTVNSTLTTTDLTSTTEGLKTKFTANSGTFINILVGGTSCPEALKGNKAVKGSATSVANGTTSQEFTETSSALTFGGQAATFLGKYHTATKANGVLIALEEP